MLAAVRALVLSLILVLVASASVEAQQATTTQVPDSLGQAGAAADVADAAVAPTPVTQGLPRRAPQPRTLHDFWPGFAILAVLWVAMLIYVLPMRGSLRRIAERMLEEENRTAGQ